VRIGRGLQAGQDALGKWAWMAFDEAGDLTASGWDYDTFEGAAIAAQNARKAGTRRTGQERRAASGMSGRRRPYSQAIPRWQRMRSLQREGLRIVDIAERMNCPPNSVTFGLKRFRELEA
jgi:hypothetical protein